MRLYCAAIYTNDFGATGKVRRVLTPEEQAQRDYVVNFLDSYHYIKKQSYVDKIRYDKEKVFLDSGAFSAFSLGKEIDIGEYCDYIHRNQDIIEVASVLDAIGDAEGTWRNQEEMERRGCNPLPCFHYGEPVEVLDHYVNNYDHITIGGMVPISTPQLRVWLDRLWERHLTNADGTAKVKVHGFGLTALGLMMEYPWYSVDSSSWVQMAANGTILLPDLGKALAVSASSPNRKTPGQHVDSITDIEKQVVLKELERHGGSLERLQTVYQARFAWNVWAFPYFARHKNDFENDKYIPKTQELF